MKDKGEFACFFSQGVDGVEDLGLPNKFLLKPVLAGKIQKQNAQEHREESLAW